MIVGSTITVLWDELSSKERERLERALTFTTARGEVVMCYRTIPGVKIVIPRGAWHLVGQLDFRDRRTKPSLPRLDFTLTLDDLERDKRFSGQQEAVQAILEHEQGLVVRAPGTGKTQIALAFAAKAETRTLVLVHTKDILDQWVAAIEQTIPSARIGVIQGKKGKIEHINVGMVQTITKFLGDNFYDDWWSQFGAVILDEAHHGAATSFELVLNELPAFYRVGFTASLTRADGMHPYLKHLIGPVIHKQKFSSPIDLKVLPIRTDFRFKYRGTFDWPNLLNALVVDEGRNERIARIVDREVSKGNSILVLSRRIEHLELIAGRVSAPSGILVGSIAQPRRRELLRDFKAGRLRCLFATQLADEALDVPRCNRVVLTYPGKHEGRLIQQIGRTIRNFPDKKDARVIDLVDRRVGVLSRQWKLRKHTYKKEGISIKKRKLKIGGRDG